MYHLHYNENTQKFYIIPTGVTISPHIHGEKVAGSAEKAFLQGFVRGYLSAFGSAGKSLQDVKISIMSNYDAEILVD